MTSTDNEWWITPLTWRVIFCDCSQWVVLQNSMRIEFAHTHLHTTQLLYNTEVIELQKSWVQWCMNELSCGGQRIWSVQSSLYSVTVTSRYCSLARLYLEPIRLEVQSSQTIVSWRHCEPTKITSVLLAFSCSRWDAHSHTTSVKSATQLYALTSVDSVMWTAAGIQLSAWICIWVLWLYWVVTGRLKVYCGGLYKATNRNKISARLKTLYVKEAYS